MPRSSRRASSSTAWSRTRLPRDEVYHFLQLGRYLERVNVMGRILHAKCRSHNEGANGGDPPMQLVRWTGLLRSCSAYGAYLRVERDRVEPVGVIRFLVLNPDFPRAIRFCVARCRESLQEIAGGGDDDEYASEAERLLGTARQRAALYRRRRDLRARAAPVPRRHPDHLPACRRRNPAVVFL